MISSLLNMAQAQLERTTWASKLEPSSNADAEANVRESSSDESDNGFAPPARIWTFASDAAVDFLISPLLQRGFPNFEIKGQLHINYPYSPLDGLPAPGYSFSMKVDREIFSEFHQAGMPGTGSTYDTDADRATSEYLFDDPPANGNVDREKSATAAPS